jgi:hypothetical protein
VVDLDVVEAEEVPLSAEGEHVRLGLLVLMYSARKTARRVAKRSDSTHIRLIASLAYERNEDIVQLRNTGFYEVIRSRRVVTSELPDVIM